MFFKLPNKNEAPKKDLELSDPELKKHFESDPGLKVRERDTKIGEILKREFKGLHRKEEGLKFLIYGAGRDVSFTRGWDKTPPENFKFIERSGSKAHHLSKFGLDAEKHRAEIYRADEQADVVVALDKELTATWKFLRNTTPNGYLLCRADVATGAHRTGKYELMGLMSVHGNQWAFLESKEYDLVQDDAQFQKAPKVEGSVSHEEARKTLEKLNRPTNDVFREYQKLIEETLDQNKELVEDGQTTLTYTDSSGNLSAEVNTVLPRQNGSDDDIYVLRKKGSA